MPDLVTLIAYHRTEVPFVSELHRFHPKSRPQNPVKRSRCSSALKVPQHATASLLIRARGNFASYDVANSAQTKFTALNVPLHLLSVFRPGAFGDHHQRTVIAAGIAFFDHGRDLIVIERD